MLNLKIKTLSVITIVMAAGLVLSCNTVTLFGKPTATPLPMPPTNTAQPKATVELRPTQTKKVSQAATKTMVPALPTTTVSGGQVEVLDYIYRQDFSKTSADWTMDPYQDDNLEVVYTLDKGVFSWGVTAAKNSSVMKVPEPNINLPEDGFLLSVSTRTQPKIPTASTGLLFRLQDFKNLYYAKLNAVGEVSAYALEKNVWKKLAGPVKSEHFIEDAFNRLTVVDKNGDYEIQVNDYPVLNFSDERFKGGGVGLIAELMAGTEGHILFDDLDIMKAGGSAASANETQPTQQNTIPEAGGTYETYHGDFHGVKYSINYPGGFTHASRDGWELFCLQGKACFGVHPQNGTWSDAQDMSEKVLSVFRQGVSNFKISHQQSTTTKDGFSAYWVGCTYTQNAANYESSRMFVMVQQVGFELAGYGDPDFMKTYGPIFKTMMESFTFEYN